MIKHSHSCTDDSGAAIPHCNNNGYGCYACCPYSNEVIPDDDVVIVEENFLGKRGRAKMLELIAAGGRPLPGNEFVAYLKMPDDSIMAPDDNKMYYKRH